MDGKDFGLQTTETQTETHSAERRITTQTAESVLGKDGIVRVRMLPGTKEDLASAKATIAALSELCDGGKRAVIVDMAGTLSATQDARRYYSSEHATDCMTACAMLVGSPLSKVLGSFFLGLNKPRHPMRLFTSEPEAVSWLKGYQT